MTREYDWREKTQEEKKDRLEEKRSTMTTIAESEIASEREKLYGRLHHTDDDDDDEEDEEQNVPTTTRVTMSRKRKRHSK